MSPNNLISILLPVKNGEKYLRQAIDSVLNQTYNNFELIIIDNNSIDNTNLIIKEYVNRDHRVKSLKCEEDGIVYALNAGTYSSTGDYIARIDCDDIWHAKKLQKQIDVLCKNPSIHLLGSSVEIIDENNTLLTNINSFNKEKQYDWKSIKRNLSNRNLFCHSSVIVKKDSLIETGGYRTSFPHSEDYDLWFRLVKLYPAHILEEKLVKFRIHKDSISTRNFVKQHISSVRVRARYLLCVGNPWLNINRLLFCIVEMLIKIISKTGVTRYIKLQN